MSAPAPSSKGFRAPHTFVIIFGVVVLAVLVTHLVPAGRFETSTVTFEDSQGAERTREVLDPDSFEVTGSAGVGLFGTGDETGLFNYAFDGLVSGDRMGAAVGVVAFLLVVGGAFGVVLRTRAIETGILASLHRTAGAEKAVIPTMFILFSLGGAVFGMGEEAIAFAMVIVPVLVALGYDSIVGVLVTFGATQIGFATSWMNPFSVGIAQGIAGVPMMSGAAFRVVMWVGFTALGLAYTWLYARRIKENPESSAAWETDAFFRDDLQQARAREVRFGLGHALVLLTVLLAIVWVVWGVTFRAYYIPEIANQFFVMGVAAGVIGAAFRLDGMGVNDIATSFLKGARDLLGAALVVGMAKGIVLVLGGDDPTTPTVLNTLLHGAGQVIAGLPPALSAWLMYLFQTILNFFVVSGSGQAALTMPLMAPLADIAGVSRQVAVLTFQLGDGFANIIGPTSGALIGTLGVARIDWAVWARMILPLMAILFAGASVFVVVAVAIGYQ